MIKRVGAVLFLALSLASSLKAADWEFGVDPGLVYPLSRKQFGHSIDNGALYNILVAESIGDEIGEGFTPPPLPGDSTIQASYRSMAELGAHVYGNVTPWFSLGLEGGYAFKRQAYLINRGIYVQSYKFVDLGYETSLWHVAPMARFGRWMGRFRPTLAVGPDFTMISERVEVRFTDPDDVVRPEVVVDRHHVYLGAVASASLDWRVGSGSIGADLQYHKVFAGSSVLDYLEPRLRLSAYFGGDSQ